MTRLASTSRTTRQEQTNTTFASGREVELEIDADVWAAFLKHCRARRVNPIALLVKIAAKLTP
jgi:hypothetical protein